MAVYQDHDLGRGGLKVCHVMVSYKLPDGFSRFAAAVSYCTLLYTRRCIDLQAKGSDKII